MEPCCTSLRYLIGGNPAGATHFIAEYLTSCGFPTTHEQFHWDSQNETIIRTPNDVTNAPVPLAECSYTVVEWCDRPGVNHLPIISIIRNPYAVLNSLLVKQINMGESLNIDRTMGDILWRWETLDNTKRVKLHCQVEFNADLECLCEFVGVPFQLPIRNTTKWSHSNGRVLFSTYEDIKGYSGAKQFREYAASHGY